MEKKKISGKWIGIIAVAAAVVVAAILTIVHFSKSEDSYRSIQIYELEGKASIERAETGKIDAVENLYLESGDRIQVKDGSSMRLKLDDDKYIMVEENSVFTIVAEGTKKNSKTSIHLEKGAITNEIQNNLNKKSSYKVTTPNSVMAVRGTVFRVEVTTDENGEIYTRVSVFEGEVGISLILPDGTKEEELLIMKGGKEVIIHMDNEKTEYLSKPYDIDYRTLPLPCLEFLRDIIKNGRNLVGIDLEEIEALITEMSQESEEEAEVYTVTFTYNGTVFGTQTVEEGKTITAPRLAPEEEGTWDFDFSKEITEDVTIPWK